MTLPSAKAGGFLERFSVSATQADLFGNPRGAPPPELEPEVDGDGYRDITKKDVFAYTYAVLHDPDYRERYAANLRREFPRIPFYADFAQWAVWGYRLLELHADYETAEPYPLERTESAVKPRPTLRADKDAGVIDLDRQTRLHGVPAEAWGYTLGERSALEWVLDRYRERTPKDLTVRALFNTYRFADHKEDVIDLLRRVTTVSVETVRVQREMLERGVR